MDAAMAVNNDRYVEIIPDMDTGYEKYVFDLNTKNSVIKCYAFKDDIYALVFD
jgi:hypothetical protein